MLLEDQLGLDHSISILETMAISIIMFQFADSNELIKILDIKRFRGCVETDSHFSGNKIKRKDQLMRTWQVSANHNIFDVTVQFDHPTNMGFRRK